MYEKGNISSLDFYGILSKETEYSGTYNEFSVIWNNIFVPMPETIEIISSPAQNYQLVVLSNTNDLHFDYLKKSYPGIFLLFEKLFLSYEMHLRKPEDEIFQQVIKYYDILPSEIFFADDMEENVKAGRNNGISAHLFTCSSKLAEQLKDQKVQI